MLDKMFSISKMRFARGRSLLSDVVLLKKASQKQVPPGNKFTWHCRKMHDFDSNFYVAITVEYWLSFQRTVFEP